MNGLIMRILFIAALVAVINLMVLTTALAQDDKRGQAGATELLINPFARSAGWANANTSGVMGVEAMFLNVGGLAQTPGSEVSFNNTSHLVGTDINIANLGFATKTSKDGVGVLGVNLMFLDLGEFIETTELQPEGTGVILNPQFFNLSVAYSIQFSDYISAGLLLKIVQHQFANVSTTTAAADAGVQYRKPDLFFPGNDVFKFGVSIKNLGPKYSYDGDGLAFRSALSGEDFDLASDRQSDDFEVPAMLNIGTAYDYMHNGEHRGTVAFNFQSNSYTNDEYSGGIEYAFREMFMARIGYRQFGSFTSDEETTTVYTGLALGATLQIPLSEDASTLFNKKENIAEGEEEEQIRKYAVMPREKQTVLAFDYSYQDTNPFNGSHTLGVSLKF